MKIIKSSVVPAVLLITISIITYTLQLYIFRAPRDTYFYLFQDLAFLPLQVAIVTILINSFINKREKQERLKKMNMVISAFFSEVGIELVLRLNQFNMDIGNIQSHLQVSGEWTGKVFENAVKLVKGFDFKIESRAGNLQELKAFLLEKRYFLLSMLENSNLLEHDTFSDMLWAVFHITDELDVREALMDIPDTDLGHLSVDIKRAYSHLLIEWLYYMEHLKTNYPFLFSMAVRKNPYNDKACVIIR